jgi:hypothetical protein
MTARILFLITAALFITGASIHAQQAFQNLNFESANPVIVQYSPYYPNVVTAASALPDWTVTIGGVAQSQVFYNDPSTGTTWVSLVGPHDPYGNAIDGNYSVLLQGFATASAISQTGLIPVGTQSLLFEGQPGYGSPTLNVLVGTQSVPFVAVGYGLYAADISAWAGQTEQLTFSVPMNSLSWEIDDISFSATSVVPEPKIVALSALGGLMLALQQPFRKRSN